MSRARARRGVVALEAAQMRAVLDSIPARIALLDRGRRHRYVNQEYAAFLGKPAEAILGRTVAQMIGAKAYAQLRVHGARALAGETVRWEGWLPYQGTQTADGPRFVQRIYMPYRTDTGAVEGYFVFTRDLTELKRSEQQLAEQLAALRASEAMNGAILASALDCVVAIDEAGLVIAFNPAAERTFGYREADVLGRPISGLIVPPAMQARHAEGFRRYLETGPGTMLGRRVEIEGMRADGSLFPLELTITEVRLPDRQLFTAYLRDLTQAKEAAAEIERQRQALQQAEKLAALSSLLAGVAHELNNPLSIVISNALMLEEELQEKPELVSARRPARVRAAAERCADIVRDFLATARRSNVRAKPLALDELVHGVLDLLDERLVASGIEILRDMPTDLPRVRGDYVQLEQVMINLIVNAQQALDTCPPPRRIIVTGRRAGAEVEVRVADNGPGMPEALRGRIFDPFFTTKPVGAGRGLGLAVSRGIVEAHGGSLTLSAAKGETCFQIWLPAISGHGGVEPNADGSGSVIARASGHGLG